MRMSQTKTVAICMLVGTLLTTPAVSSAAQKNPLVTTEKTAAPAPAVSQETARPFQLNAEQTRRQLIAILRQYPPSLNEVLKTDPSLLSNRDYLSLYPSLRDFLADHPEIPHNPSYFVGEWREELRDSESYRIWRDVTEGVSIAFVFVTVVGMLAWLIKTAVDYRRWLRLSKLQQDTHSRLMDRLTTNEDLLAYIQTPAGQQFLQSSPLQTEMSPQMISAPLGRILWSAQIGLVLAFAGLGLYYAFSRLAPDRGTEPFFVISILALALGVGFIVSAGVAFVLSQRLGLLDDLKTRRVTQNNQPSTQP